MASRTDCSGRPRGARPQVSLGSVQYVGLRRLPLVQVELGPAWTFDVYASIAYGLRDRHIADEYVLGVTHLF